MSKIRKAPSAHVTNASHLDEYEKLNLVTSEKSIDFSCVIRKAIIPVRRRWNPNVSNDQGLPKRVFTS